MPCSQIFFSCLIPSHIGLLGNEKANLLANGAFQLPMANYNALTLQDYISSIRHYIQCVVDGNKLTQLNPSLAVWSSCSHTCRCLEIYLSCLCISHAHLTCGHLEIIVLQTRLHHVSLDFQYMNR